MEKQGFILTTSHMFHSEAFPLLHSLLDYQNRSTFLLNKVKARWRMWGYSPANGLGIPGKVGLQQYPSTFSRFPSWERRKIRCSFEPHNGAPRSLVVPLGTEDLIGRKCIKLVEYHSRTLPLKTQIAQDESLPPLKYFPKMYSNGRWSDIKID